MDLVTLLDAGREEIASAWTERLRALAGNLYREQPAADVLAWTKGAVDAIVESRRTGSPAPLEQHAAAVSRERAAQRFEIDQVIEGLLLLHEVALPFLFGGPRGASGARGEGALAAGEDLSAALRLLVAQFAAVFARLLREQDEHLAVLEERTRLARELHDSVSQMLYGVGMYAEAAARLLERGEIASASDHLRAVRDSAGDALREMRYLVFELRPSILREEGLVPALRARLSAVEERAGVETTLAADLAGVRLTGEVEDALYGIAREALNNALRHARAARVAVRLTRQAAATLLSVTDNGTGFDPEAGERNGGLGLGGMRERAARIDATLEVRSRPGEGTEVRVVVPDRALTATHPGGEASS